MKKYVVAVMLWVAVPAFAQEAHTCWAAQESEPLTGRIETVTRCRVSGQIVDYATEYEVPLRLFAAVVTDVNGTCWYWRTVWTGWEMITRNSDGTAAFGFDSDGTPGGPLNVDVTYPVCTSEPSDAQPTDLMVWDMIRDYVHQLPGPGLNPAVPWGLAGAETFLNLAPPAAFADAIVDPTGQVLEVVGSVGAIGVNWGDGSSLTLAPETYGLLTGYPDGSARHTYQVKTCDVPGSTPRCHPTLSSYPIEVSYQWFVQWRVGAGPWATLEVPDTTTTIPYPVQEIISVLDRP